MPCPAASSRRLDPNTGTACCAPTFSELTFVGRTLAKFVRILFYGVVVAAFIWVGYEARDKNLALSDLRTWMTEPAPIGERSGNPLQRLGISKDEIRSPGPDDAIRYVGLTKYLNAAKAVVTHTADDSSPKVPDAIRALDRYDIKATFFISTARKVADDLWPVLVRAVQNGHEIGSHARTHPCQFPPDRKFCFLAYSDHELIGSRDDILARVDQPHVWSFAYPCGLCNQYDFVHRKLRHAGYLVARIYPDESRGGHLVPDMNTWDDDRYRATYTQAVQKKGGIAPEGRTDVPAINAKFDEVYEQGGIYNFLTHPSWLDYDEGNFYEQHLSHIARRDDVWYVPIGPLYAYRDVVGHTKIHSLGEGRFAIVHDLSPIVYPNSVTLEFEVDAAKSWEMRTADGVLPTQAGGPTYGWDREYARQDGKRLLVTVHPNTLLTIRSR